MPLDMRDTPDAFSSNVAKLIGEGRSKAQAVAISYSVRRRGRKKPAPERRMK
jgi:hypothetical protein